MHIYYKHSRPDAFIDRGIEPDVITAYGHKEIGVDRLHLYTQDTVFVGHDVEYVDTGVILYVPKPTLFIVKSLHHDLIVHQRVRPHGLLFYEIVHLFIGVRSRFPKIIPAHTLIAELEGFSFTKRVYFVYNPSINNHNGEQHS